MSLQIVFELPAEMSRGSDEARNEGDDESPEQPMNLAARSACPASVLFVNLEEQEACFHGRLVFCFRSLAH